MQPPDIFVFFGLIASGKSTLAKAWARRRQIACFNSDLVRKELAGITPTAKGAAPFGQGIYTPEFSRKTYDHLLALAELELCQGKSVVLDGSYQARGERDRLRDLALRHEAVLYFILCTCTEEETRQRLALRAKDPTAVSDGRWEIFLKQRSDFALPPEMAPDEMLTIDTMATVSELVKTLEITIAGT